MEFNFDDSLNPFQVLKRINSVFPDTANIKQIFDDFDWKHNNPLCMETLRYLAGENLISKVNGANYKIEDGGRTAINEGSIEKYLEKINAEKQKRDELNALQERSLREGIKHSREMLKMAKDANTIANNANKKANISNAIAIISAIAAIVSALLTCNRQ